MPLLDLGSGLIQHRVVRNGAATAFGPFSSHQERRESSRRLRTLESTTQSNIEVKENNGLVERLFEVLVFPEGRQEHSAPQAS